MSGSNTPRAEVHRPLRPARRKWDVGLALAWLAGCLVAVVAVAHVAGWLTTSVVSGASMEPYANSGDLIIAKQKAAYAVGDVVIFDVPDGEPGSGQVVAHRIVDVDSGGLRTQGDNRDSPDLWNIRQQDIRGSVFTVIPFATLHHLVVNPITIGLVAALLSCALVAMFLPTRSPSNTTRSGEESRTSRPGDH